MTRHDLTKAIALGVREFMRPSLPGRYTSSVVPLTVDFRTAAAADGHAVLVEPRRPGDWPSLLVRCYPGYMVTILKAPNGRCNWVGVPHEFDYADPGVLDRLVLHVLGELEHR